MDGITTFLYALILLPFVAFIGIFVFGFSWPVPHTNPQYHFGDHVRVKLPVFYSKHCNPTGHLSRFNLEARTYSLSFSCDYGDPSNAALISSVEELQIPEEDILEVLK